MLRFWRFHEWRAALVTPEVCGQVLGRSAEARYRALVVLYWAAPDPRQRSTNCGSDEPTK